MYKNQEQFVIKSEAWSRWDSFAKPQTLISLDTSMSIDRDGGSGEGGVRRFWQNRRRQQEAASCCITTCECNPDFQTLRHP